jgi:hypothetical protein
MHCPRCGHQQNSDEIRFCTKCGLEISDVKALLAPERVGIKAQRRSENQKAARQGLMLVFSGFAVILILAMLRDFYAVPKFLFALTVLIFIIGGAVRMSMPSLFGSNKRANGENDLREAGFETNKLKGEQFFDKSLPEAEYRPPVNFGAKVYDTNDLAAPLSVTENTTRQLEKEFQPK